MSKDKYRMKRFFKLFLSPAARASTRCPHTNTNRQQCDGSISLQTRGCNCSQKVKDWPSPLTLKPNKPPWRNFLHDCVPVCVLLSFVRVSPDLCDPALQGNDCGRLIIIVPHQSRKGKGSIGMKWWEPGGLLMAVALARLPPVSGFLPWSAVCLLECLLFWMHSIEDTNCIIHGRQAGNGKDEWWPQFLSWQRRSRE